MPQGQPMPQERYLHFKNREYQVTAIAKDAETGKTVVVYQALYAPYQMYVRSYEEFVSPVDHIKYPDVKQQWRFAYMGRCGDADSATESTLSCESQGAGEVSRTTTKRRTVTMDERRKVRVYGSKEDPIPIDAIPRVLLEFLDADDYTTKYNVVKNHEMELDDHLINQMAASIDEVIEDGRLEERVAQLSCCLRTKAQFETNRH